MNELTTEAREAQVRAFFGSIPYNVALGLTFDSLEDAACAMRMPYRDDLAAHGEHRAICTSALTGLLDAACGAAVFMALTKQITIATLDLRVDFLGRAQAGTEVLAVARCHHRTANVAFATAVARHPDGTEVARAMGTFMLDTPAHREGG